MSGVMLALAPCLGCGLPFQFDPDVVPSIRVMRDPDGSIVTNPDGSAKQPETDAEQERAVREPICPACCAVANVERRRRGLPPIPTADTTERAWERQNAY
jgi:hypothetical protein